MAKAKFKSWLIKFLPAEIIGTLTAVGAGSFCHLFSDNGVFIAYVASFGEAIGFYATIIIQSIFSYKKEHSLENIKFSLKAYTNIISTIIIEFGPAGLIDGLFLRPLFMFLFPILLGNFTLGLLIGKLVGDLTFYVLVILSSEIKGHFKNKNNGSRPKK